MLKMVIVALVMPIFWMIGRHIAKRLREGFEEAFDDQYIDREEWRARHEAEYGEHANKHYH